MVGVDFTGRSRGTRAGAEGARRAALRSKEDEAEEFKSGESEDRPKAVVDSPGLDADESLAEFRELIRSAGGEIAWIECSPSSSRSTLERKPSRAKMLGGSL